MIRIKRPEADADRLEGLFRSTTDREFWDRLQIISKAHRSRLRRDVAADQR